MDSTAIIVLLGCTSVLVYCTPVEEPSDAHGIHLTAIDFGEVFPQRQKRFINPSLTLGGFAGTGFQKLRTKRSEEDCEKLQLCKLHARSHRNFISAFQLYFVNRENARLWDHHERSVAECNARFDHCW